MSKEAAMAVASQSSAPSSAIASIPSASPSVSGSPTQAPAQEPTAPIRDPAFERLAQKEASLIKMQQQLKQKESVIQNAEKIVKDANEWREEQKKDPVAALKKMGFDETHLFNYLAATIPEELTPEQKVTKTIEQVTDAKLQAYQQAEAKKAADAQRAQDTQLIRGYQGDISKVMDAQKERYEYAADKGDEATQVAMRMAWIKAEETQGEDIYTSEQALEAVNEYYRNEWQRQAKLKGSQEWLKTQLEAPMAEKKTGERSRTVTPGFPGQPQQAPVISRSRTIPNNATVTSASFRPKGPETPSQKRERLIKKLANGG